MRVNSLNAFSFVHRGGCDGLIFGKDEIAGEERGKGRQKQGAIYTYS